MHCNEAFSVQAAAILIRWSRLAQDLIVEQFIVLVSNQIDHRAELLFT